MAINFAEIKSMIDNFSDKYLRYYPDHKKHEDYRDSEIKICKLIMNLIVADDYENSMKFIKYMKHKKFIRHFLIATFNDESNYEILKKVYKNNKAFIIFFTDNLCYAYKFNYKDYKFFSYMKKYSNYFVISYAIDNCLKSYEVKDEITFLYYLYDDKIERNLFGQKDLLEYFEEVCSTMDFSDEYKKT